MSRVQPGPATCKQLISGDCLKCGNAKVATQRKQPTMSNRQAPLEAYPMQDQLVDDKKGDDEQVESLGHLPGQITGAAAPQSAFAGLPPGKAILKFRRLFVMGMLTSVGAM